MVTAGLMCAPVTPPATYTPQITANIHPKTISNQSPVARKIVGGDDFKARPDWFSAATAIATTPSPNMIRVNVPKNSARYSPLAVFRQVPRLAPATVATYPPPKSSGSYYG